MKRKIRHLRRMAVLRGCRRSRSHAIVHTSSVPLRYGGPRVLLGARDHLSRAACHSSPWQAAVVLHELRYEIEESLN
jgi:hypothetical protein